jgi:hypothetical protein
MGATVSTPCRYGIGGYASPVSTTDPVAAGLARGSDLMGATVSTPCRYR